MKETDFPRSASVTHQTPPLTWMQGSLCDEFVTSMVRINLKPFITAPVIGANTTGQLTDSMGAADLVLSEEEISEISKVADWEKSRTDREA